MRKELDGLRDLEERYKRVVEDNRTLYNTVQDLRGNIRVFCRFVTGSDISACIRRGDAAVRWTGILQAAHSKLQCVQITS
jgi:hypothetical protein